MISEIILSSAAFLFLFLSSPTLPVKTNSSLIESDSAGYTIDKCVSEFDLSRIDSTKAGYEYWFVDRKFAGGKTIKLSVVRPHEATHPPHHHVEDEFFFVLEGKAQFYLAGQTRTVGPYTSLYCPSNVEHGIRNVGDAELRYLVIKKYRTQ